MPEPPVSDKNSKLEHRRGHPLDDLSDPYDEQFVSRRNGTIEATPKSMVLPSINPRGEGGAGTLFTKLNNETILEAVENRQVLTIHPEWCVEPDDSTLSMITTESFTSAPFDGVKKAWKEASEFERTRAGDTRRRQGSTRVEPSGASTWITRASGTGGTNRGG